MRIQKHKYVQFRYQIEGEGDSVPSPFASGAFCRNACFPLPPGEAQLYKPGGSAMP
jgi:hypothetical protein